MRLRSHLVALVLAALVPVLGFAALVMRENAQLQLAATERGMRDTASAVARTVDKELETAITALEAIGQSEHLDTMNLARFYELCDRVTRTQGWVNILLFETDGRALMQTSVPLGMEDNTDAREMLRHLLNLAGHEVHEAADGPAGLEAALRLRPDIALIDVGLPGFDGYQLARHVRGSAGPSIYLVALTGYGQPDDRRQAMEAGFDAHLVKPVNPDALLTAIQNAGHTVVPGDA